MRGEPGRVWRRRGSTRSSSTRRPMDALALAVGALAVIWLVAVLALVIWFILNFY